MTQPPATGAKILEAVEQLNASIETLISAVKQLQNVVRSEQEHTRRALLMHFGAEGLEKEHGK